MKIVDSSVWIDYFNGKITRETNLLHQLLGSEPVSIGNIILTEVLQGFSSDKDFDTAKKSLLSLPCYQMIDTNIALKSVEHYRFLRKKGITVRKTIDMIICTFCIENDASLLHSDRDFQFLETHLGLKCL
ncbi:MAG: PIN domain nuclease [Lewinellaceae bacterium]|nr:PIN domain nuclease [Phaeodactylibacter sp.]MCB9038547.1 PIN domain nuclease [Lewinellaceae bacterium]